jgi:hypothetical protein
MKLILLPGIYGTKALFGDFLQHLSPAIEPMVISLPTGDERDYDRIVDHVVGLLPEDEDYVILAESFSGAIAKEISENPPPHLLGIILVAGFLSSPNPLLKIAASWLPMTVVQRCARSRWLLRRFCVGADADPQLVAQVSQVMSALPPASVRARFAAMASRQDNHHLVNTPVCYIQPLEDRLVTNARVREVKEVMPGGLVCRLQAPHFALQAQPLVCAGIVNHFVQKLPRRRAVVRDRAAPFAAAGGWPRNARPIAGAGNRGLAQ